MKKNIGLKICFGIGAANVLCSMMLFLDNMYVEAAAFQLIGGSVVLLFSNMALIEKEKG